MSIATRWEAVPATQRWAERAISVSLMSLSFAVAATVGFALLENRAIAQLDVWFQADANDYLAHRFYPDLFRHPNVGVFLGAVVSAAGGLLRAVGIGVSEAVQTQEWLMMLVAPVLGAIRTLAAYHALGLLTASRPLAVLLALLDLAAFATVALASVPESFGPTAASLAVLYWLLITDAKGARIRWLPWIAVGTFAAGITLTNLVPFALLVSSTLIVRGERFGRVLLETASAATGVLALTAAITVGTSLVTGQPLEERIDSSTGRFLRATPSRADTVELLLGMTHTFLAPLAKPAPGTEPPVNNPDYDFQLLLPTSLPASVLSWWREALTIALLSLGGAGYLRCSTKTIWLLPAAAVVAANFVLHLFYGHHYFLYSLHWAFSMVWIIAGVAFLPGRARTVGVAGVALFLVVTAVNSVALMQRLLEYLRAV